MHSELDVLFKSDVALVRLMALKPHEVGKKHFHTELFETVICVEGEISMFVVGSEPKVIIAGQQASIAALKPHWLQNNNGAPATYLLAQSGGAYDFCPVSE